MGAVFATCCSHKIPDRENAGKDMEFYLDFYYPESVLTQEEIDNQLICEECPLPLDKQKTVED